MAPAKKQQGKTQAYVRLQVSYLAPARAPRGVRRPSDQLAEILFLVNLAPPDFDWWSWPEHKGEMQTFEEAKAALLLELKKLPANLRAHLLEHMHQPEEWETFPWLKADLSSTLSIEGLYNVVPRYRQIREWRENLRRIANREQYIHMTALGAFDWSRGAVEYSKDRFSAAIDGEDLRYVRECVICHRLYYAGRLFYQGKELEPYCSLACGKKVRAKRSPKSPAKLEEIKTAVKKLCKAKGWEQFDRTEANVEMLCERVDATAKQCNRALEYLARTATNQSGPRQRGKR